MRGGGIGCSDLAAVVLTGSPRSGLVVWGSGGPWTDPCLSALSLLGCWGMWWKYQ